MSLSSLGEVSVMFLVVVVLVAPALVPRHPCRLRCCPHCGPVDVDLIFDCCVPSPPEEDHRLPPSSGKVPSWPSLPSFIDCRRRRRRRTTSPHPCHSFFASAASWSHSLLTRSTPPHKQRNHITSMEKAGKLFFIYGTTFMILDLASSDLEHRSQKQKKN